MGFEFSLFIFLLQIVFLSPISYLKDPVGLSGLILRVILAGADSPHFSAFFLCRLRLLLACLQTLIPTDWLLQ